MRILLGIDDSPHSKAALEHVCHGSWPPDTRVTVLSAVRVPVYVYAPADFPAIPAPEQVAALTKEHEALVCRAQKRLREAGLAGEARVVHGDAREALVETARNESTDLVVVGSHGRTGLSKLLLGSVASHVVTHSPCSVLVVKLPGWRG